MPHISFSELKNWVKCPWYHKVSHIDKSTSFQGNELTAFGNALHDVCETILVDNSDNLPLLFKKSFLNELKKLPEDYQKRPELIYQMKRQGEILAPLVEPAIESYFGSDVEIISAEERLFEGIAGFTDAKYDFKGFIDAVFKTSDGKYHIVDWKTCSWGWDRKKKAEKMITYQLTFYKYFYALKHNIDPHNIETHFALLKRTANKNHVEFFRVTSGKRKTENALKLLYKALYNINRKNYMKNRLVCNTCDLFNTEYCSR